MSVRKRRHPWRGVIGGILLGLSLAIFSVVYGFNALGPLTPWILLILGVVVGVALVFVPRPWGRRPGPRAPTEPGPAPEPAP